MNDPCNQDGAAFTINAIVDNIMLFAFNPFQGVDQRSKMAVKILSANCHGLSYLSEDNRRMLRIVSEENDTK